MNPFEGACSCPCDADNVPGVAGIGPKTAVALLKQHGTLENLIEHAAEVKPKKAALQLSSGAAGGVLPWFHPAA